jgi:hypothetical protein
MAKGSSGKSKKSGLAGRPATGAPKGKAEIERVIEFGPPLKPRKGLLIALSVLFALWFAFLLGLYFKSVYPQRHPSHPNPAATRQAARSHREILQRRHCGPLPLVTPRFCQRLLPPARCSWVGYPTSPAV